MSYASIERIIEKTDNLASRYEIRNINRVESAMESSFEKLEARFRRLYLEAESKDISGRDRAILVMSQLKDYLSVLSSDDSKIESLYSSLLSDAAQVGINFAEQATSAIDSSFVGQTAKINVDAVAVQARDASKRLYRHDADFQLRASKIIESGLVTGQGAAKVALGLRQALGIAKGAAQSIARTETLSSLNTSAKEAYRRNGIEFVQLFVTRDDRTCPVCVARSGNVYQADKVQVPLHPQCRCYLSPWRSDWLELGLIDEAWLRDTRESAIAELRDAGKEPNYGLSPFEKMNNLSKPEAVWKPS